MRLALHHKAENIFLLNRECWSKLLGKIVSKINLMGRKSSGEVK
jgi:hypothetical protein